MEKNSKGSILTPILLSAALVLGVVIGLFAGRNSVDRRLRSLAGELDSPGGKISYALSLIDRYYVDPVSTDSLVEALMPDLMWYLDPHSVYIPASELCPRLRDFSLYDFRGQAPLRTGCHPRPYKPYHNRRPPRLPSAAHRSREMSYLHRRKNHRETSR